MQKLGSRQIETLRQFWRYPDGLKFQPTRAGKPWPTIKALVARGLMWARREQFAFWNPLIGDFNRPMLEWRAGLTPEGREAFRLAIEPVSDHPVCQAARDGDCIWTHCPQMRDGEPAKSGRHCPLDRDEEEA